MRRLVGAGVGILLVGPAGCMGPDADRDIADRLETDIEAYLEAVDVSDMVRAVLVHHRGEPVFERYFGSMPQDHHGVASITKSVVSALIGVAISEGSISGVEATLGELLPAYRASMTPDVAAVTLRELLTHTGGFAPGDGEVEALEYWTEPDWVRAIVEDRAVGGASEGFTYSNAGSHLLSAVLAEATDRPVLDYARDRLFQPLGIDAEPALEKVYTGLGDDSVRLWREYQSSDFAWSLDPQGNHEGATGLRLTPGDLVAFGSLFLNDGRSGAHQVVPEEWVAASTASSIAAYGLLPGYGYQWWVSDLDGAPMFAAAGFHGQLVAVVPDRELVAVVASHDDPLDPAFGAKAFNTGEAIALVENWIAPAFGE